MKFLNPLIFLSMVIAAFSPLGCLYEEDDSEIWEEYCFAAEECATMSGQMFSMTECKLEYKESFERHESIGCRVQYENYLDCAIELPCAAWDDVSQACAWETDALNACVN